MSKTVITSSGAELNAVFDRRFGRAAWYCIIDDTTGATEFIRNENHDAHHGAGTRAAEKMIGLKVTRIISGDFGPKAKELLDKFNIQMVIIQDDDATIQDIIDKLKQ